MHRNFASKQSRKRKKEKGSTSFWQELIAIQFLGICVQLWVKLHLQSAAFCVSGKENAQRKIKWEHSVVWTFSEHTSSKCSV